VRIHQLDGSKAPVVNLDVALLEEQSTMVDHMQRAAIDEERLDDIQVATGTTTVLVKEDIASEGLCSSVSRRSSGKAGLA
jgi:hypothetical protein